MLTPCQSFFLMEGHRLYPLRLAQRGPTIISKVHYSLQTGHEA